MSTNGRELRQALSTCRHAFIMTAVFSFFINLLVLVSPIYMMQIYNRVLPTRSEATLLVLTGLVVGLLLAMALLDVVRSRLLVRVSGRLDLLLSGRILGAVFGSTLGTQRGPGAEGLRDFDAIRQFMAGNGTLAFFDAPWTPVMIGVTFLFHPLLGWVAVAGTLILFGLAALNEVATRRAIEDSNRHAGAILGAIGGGLRNAEAIQAMGMFGDLKRRWFARRHEMLRMQEIASDRAGAIQAVSKTFRMALQIALLGVGAWLVIHDQMSAGGIIASSIVVGRALAPVETAVATWRQFVHARAAWHRLSALLAAHPEPAWQTSLPRPTGALAIEDVSAVPPGGVAPTLRRVSFAAEAGQVIGVVGPSGGGKSTLARVIVGAWMPSTGTVRLDGADVHNWNRSELGPHIGYLPQDVELFEGTVAENIARFGDLDSEKIVAAAQRAGVHDMILRLPQGYETPIGPGGQALSGGQRQRIALARAVYGDPALVVLDEPNSNLDTDGESALINTVLQMKEAGVTVVVITHRPSILGTIDTLIVLVDGEVRMAGPRAEVLARLTRPVVAAEGDVREARRS